MSSSQSEDGRSLDKGSENFDVSFTKPKLSYSREFLLSLTNLDSCEKLPSGFDESLIRKPKLSYSREFLLSLTNLDSCKKLPRGFVESPISEFEDALIRQPDRPRIPGSLSSQGFRRNDYSASPPTRGDAGNYSRGIYGKWDSRSSLRSDRDSASQSDKDSDSGRCFGPQSRRSCQTPEHDGLLGSGSFPRPSGYAAGISAPKPRANEPNQFNRSNEPNQLNRSNEPYHPPRPYKAVPHSRRDTDSINDETFGSLECTNEDRAETERKRRADFEMMRKEQHKTLQEKQKSNPEKHKGGVFSDLGEVLGDSKEEKGFLGRNKEFDVPGGIPIPSNNLEKPFTPHSPASRPLVPPGFKTNTIEKGSGSKFLVPSSEVAKTVTGEILVDADAHLIPSTNGGLGDGQPGGKKHPSLLSKKRENANVFDSLDVPIKRYGQEDQSFQVTHHSDSHGALGDPEIAELNAGVLEDKTASGPSRNYSTSLLEKILGSTLPVDDVPSNSVENHDIKSEDKRSLNSAESSKFAQWFFEEEATAATDVSSSTPNDLLSLIVSGDKVNVVPDQVCIYNKEEAIPAVLTCEDLEQSILSEYIAKPTNVQPAVEKWSAINANSEKSSAHVDNHASLHLLSMLHKSADPSNSIMSSAADINLSDKPILSQENNNIAKMIGKRNAEENVKTLPDSGTSLTLETLFGSAFMNELQSVGAPVSVQRGPVEPTRVDLSDNFPTEEAFSKGFQFQLPEEENLISAGDARDRRMLNFMPAGNLINNVSLTSNTPSNITEKLAALSVKDERSMESSESLNFPLDYYEKMGPAIFRNMEAQNSSPRFQHTPQMPQGRQLYNNHLEPPHPTARMGSQPKFVNPEPVFDHHDAHTNHQMSPNMVRPNFHHPDIRVSGFDIPSQHSMMHQMQMPGNHPSQFPRGFPVPHNSGNQSNGFNQEMNHGQGSTFGPRQPNTASRGMPMPGNQHEAFQRLIEMELRANSKKTRPLAPGQNNPDMMQWL